MNVNVFREIKLYIFMQVYGWAMVVLVIALILLCNMANPYGWMSFGSLH